MSSTVTTWLPDAAGLKSAVAALQAGGLIVYPTETFYALAAWAPEPQYVARLRAIKQRSLGKALPLIACSMDAVQQVLVLDAQLAGLAQNFWPGPLTLVGPATPAVPAWMRGPQHSIAVRISAHAIAVALARACGGTIISTSANLQGRPPPRRLEGLDPQLVAHVAGMLQGGTLAGGAPSTLVTSSRGGLQILRSGAIAEAALRAAVAAL